METLLIKSNGQWELNPDHRKTHTHNGDYEINSKRLHDHADDKSYTNWHHDVSHKGKHVGNFATVEDGEGKHSIDHYGNLPHEHRKAAHQFLTKFDKNPNIPKEE